MKNVLLVEVPDGCDEVRLVMNKVTLDVFRYGKTGTPTERGIVIRASEVYRMGPNAREVTVLQ